LCVRIAIVTLATENYLIGMKNLYLSLQDINHDLDLVEFICITDSEVKNEVLGTKKIAYTKLHDLSEIRNVKLSKRFSVTIQKFQIFEILQQGCFDRLIFLDSDLLCASDISALLESNLSESVFLTVRDFACGIYYGEKIKEIGISADLIFNTGFMVLNKEILKMVNYNKIIQMLNANITSYDEGDQGLFNCIFQELQIPVTFLPIVYNDALDFNYPLSFSIPKFIHFTGSKPWYPNNQVKFYDKNYYRYYKSVTKFYSSNRNNVGFKYKSTRKLFHVYLVLCIAERLILKLLYKIFTKSKFV